MSERKVQAKELVITNIMSVISDLEKQKQAIDVQIEALRKVAERLEREQHESLQEK